jgi:hypothetical protein
MTRPRLTLPAAVAAVAAIGLLRSAWLHFVAEPAWRFAETRQERVDARYQPLRGALPPRGVVAYRSDSPQGSERFARRYTMALYSLAPLQLVPDDGALPLVLVDVDDPAALPAVAAQAGPALVERRSAEVALLRRRSP